MEFGLSGGIVVGRECARRRARSTGVGMFRKSVCCLRGLSEGDGVNGPFV